MPRGDDHRQIMHEHGEPVLRPPFWWSRMQSCKNASPLCVRTQGKRVWSVHVRDGFAHYNFVLWNARHFGWGLM